MSNTKHIVIVGGGVIGLCTAYYAIERGHKVTLIERGDPNHDSCSLGNAGLVVPSHIIPLAAPGMISMGFKMMWNSESPFYVKPRLDMDLFKWGWHFMRSATEAHVNRSAPLLRDLNMASRACFEELANSSSNSFGLVKKGLLMLCKEDKSLYEESLHAEKAMRYGLPTEILSPEEASKLDPNIQMDIAGAVLYPKDCHLSPNLFVDFLTNYLQENGVCFKWSSDDIKWNATSNQIAGIQSKGELIEGDEYLLAAGSWSAGIARQLGLNIPIQAGRGYSLTVENPLQLPEIPSILTEARVAVTPMGSSLRLGGTMEIAGLNNPVNAARVRGITKSIPNYFPQFANQDFQAVPTWSGYRPCSPDGLPYIGRTRRFSNLSVAAGHAMMGLSLGPVTGKIIASILSDEDHGFDLQLLNPERFN